MNRALRLAFPVLTVAALAAGVPAQAAWSRLYPPTSPPARSAAVMAAHEATGGVVLLSGAVSASGGWSAIGDCWILQGSTWAPFNGPRPPARILAAMAADAGRQRLVLFGGYASGAGDLADTWEWTGTSWAQRGSPLSPPARSQHSLAYDRERGVTVLFGGSSGSSVFMGDTWEWDGVSWANRTPASGPDGRLSAGLAFDPVRRDVLLFGGLRNVGGAQTIANETWSWDGTGWVQQRPLSPPPQRYLPGLASDLPRRRVVLHGGYPNNDPFTWEWDGREWHVLVQAAPSARAEHAMTYDPAGRRVVVFGGSIGGYRVDDTWVFATPAPADVVPYGAGCAGPATAPMLAAAPYTLPWVGDTHKNRATGLAAAGSAFFVTGLAATAPTSLAPLGMPGCDQLVAPALAELVAINAGAAEWPLAIPNSTAFAGVQLYQQVVALDPGANTAGLTVSNGVEMTVGIR